MKIIRTYTPIQLTDEQKNRLLKMACELFPNRDWEIWNLDRDNGMPSDVIGHDKVVVKEEDKTFKEFQCHWMEFLIYKLIPTFSKRHGPVTMTWNLKNISNEDLNMIDRFYEGYFAPYFGED